MKKTFVLAVLFLLPIIAYLFFLSGTTNFGKLAILAENLKEVPPFDDEVVLKDKISILGFLGSDINSKRSNALNLNQKIYTKVADLKQELSALADTKKWNFVAASEEEIKYFFSGLKTNLKTKIKYGFNTESVAELNNEMVDDVKIILAEYRLALKKNNTDRQK